MGNEGGGAVTRGTLSANLENGAYYMGANKPLMV